MGKICVECEDPSWTGQDPIQAPELPVDGGGVKVVDELPEKGQKGMAYVLVDDIEAPTTSQGIFVYDEGWILTAQPVSESVQMVEELPEEGQPGVLYYVPKTGDDTYDLYRWVDDSWIKVDTDVKLYSGTGQNTDGAMTQKAVSDALENNLGRARTLTTDDYNFDSDDDDVYDCVATWLLAPGLYSANDVNNVHVKTYFDVDEPDSYLVEEAMLLVTDIHKTQYQQHYEVATYILTVSFVELIQVRRATGEIVNQYSFATDWDVTNISTRLDESVIRNYGAPTSSTWGMMGTLYEDASNGKLYICTAIVPGTDPDPDTYTWGEIATKGYVDGLVGNIETALNAINNGGNS